MTRLFWFAAAAFAARAVAQTTETITITIVASNAGGDSQTQQMAPAAMAAGAVHQVTVGGDAGLVYSPDTISAAVGDMVQFNFQSQNHTVTQSSFAQPCVKLANGTASGFMPNANNTLNPPPMMMFQVLSTDPVWMFCGQKGHCGKGMVFSINPTAEKSQQAFKAAAIAQNGTANASSSSAPPPAAAAATSASSSAAAEATTATSAAAASSTSGVVAGTSSNADGQCACSCLCGVAAFPNANQGMGMMGGVAGAIPIDAAAAAPARRQAVALIS